MDGLRYLCTTSEDDIWSERPQACRIPQQDQVEIKKVLQFNLTQLQGTLEQIKRCGAYRDSDTRGSGFNLLDGEEGAAGDVTAIVAEPLDIKGAMLFTPAYREGNPEVSQKIQDSLVYLWEAQVRSLFSEFNAQNFENGKGLKPDAKMVAEGELTSIYRNGQRVLAFYRPDGVYVKVLVEVPYQLRNQLDETAAVSLVLKRTTKGNYVVHEYSKVAAVSEIQQSAQLERSFFQLEGLDKKAEEMLSSITRIEKGLEAGMKLRMQKVNLRYKRLSQVMWWPARIFGGIAGYYLGLQLMPIAAGHFGPEIVGPLPSISMLSGMLVVSKFFKELPNIHSEIAAFFSPARRVAMQSLQELEVKRNQLLEFRGEVEARRLSLVGQSACGQATRMSFDQLIGKWKQISSSF